MSVKGFYKKDKVEKYDYDSLDNKPKLGSETLSSNSKITLGVEEDDNLLYVYVDGVKQGDGIDINAKRVVKLVLSTSDIVIAEGTESSFTIKLNSRPDENQTVYVVSSNPNLLSVTPSVLTFTPNDYNDAKTVTITALQNEEMGDNSVSVTATLNGASQSVAVAIEDDDTPELVTDELTLEFDFRNLAEEATTVVDTVGGVTLTGLITSDFHKVDNGIYGSSNYKYANFVTNDTAFADFKSAMAAANEKGFTVEAFGMKLPTFANTGTAIVFNAGLAAGYNVGQNRSVSSTTTMPYFDANGDKQTYSGSAKYPDPDVNGSDETYLQADVVYGNDGTIKLCVNGHHTQWTISDFGSWDLETMLTPTNTYYLGSWQLGTNQNNYLTFIRYYGKPLSDSEIAQNIKYNKASIGISDFQ